jgi:hypothetical protein
VGIESGVGDGSGVGAAAGAAHPASSKPTSMARPIQTNRFEYMFASLSIQSTVMNAVFGDFIDR